MRLTLVRYRQHLDRMFKRHWLVQGQRVPIESGAEAELKARNIPILEVEDVLAVKVERHNIEVIGFKPKPVEFNETHPNWHDNKCLIYKDDNVLLEGIQQAKALTKTVELSTGLPSHLQNLIAQNVVPKEVDELVKRSILSSNVYETQQEKLPKIMDPNRPAHTFARVLGITDQRRNYLLTSKLLQICDKIAGPQLSQSRNVINDAFFSVPAVIDGETVQMELHAEKALFSEQGLIACRSDPKDTENAILPDLFPIKRTASITPYNIYELKNIYPISTLQRKQNIHTIFLHFTPLDVKNLYETEVTESQILGRSLLKCFTAAAANARAKYGESVEMLPEPVVVQCIQTDGRLFDFSIFQLNTLQLNGVDGIKNLWYHSERLPLYEKCCLEEGKPTLNNYNNNVIQHLLAFYNNH